ncbi:MAG: hypothetical protein MJZ82_05365 [Paludibacteraceae bacterium]|nr:hypothetical protein [Paludibacteraceae bacterium]
MKKQVFLLILLALPIFGSAKVLQPDSTRHEVRIGWGDYMFESLVYHPNHSNAEYRYTGHVFAEYQYQINNWLSAGAQVDYEQVWWKKEYINGIKMEEPIPANFYNIALMPTVRFTYFYNPWVALYSSVFLGLNINGGTELNYKGKQVALSADFGLTALGVRIGKNHWFGALEVGGLFSLNNAHEIYLLDSRILSVSIGCRL